MKRIIFFLFCVIFIGINQAKALENEYILAAVSGEGYQQIATYSSLANANYNFIKEKDNYDNLVIMQGNTILKMNSGIVEFKTNNACTLKLEFKKTNGEIANINGCYGVDALYLDSNIRNKKVTFMLSGARGEIDSDKVILHPYQHLKVRLSSYHVRNKILYHGIKSQLQNNFFLTNIALGDAPPYLKEDVIYYSYDGHYFYTDLKKMGYDAKNEATSLAINNKTPYYSYFQYLPFRTITNYESSDLAKFFKNTYRYNIRLNYFIDNNGDNLHDFFNQSQYVGQYHNFLACQYRYGVNALLLKSISMHESGNGKSLSAYKENNLFAPAAYDTPIERTHHRYNSVARSIQAFAKYYVSRLFSSTNSIYYQGSFLGDKNSGANVKYTSDPYWGEKVAEHYYKVDKSLGGYDYNAYALALIENKDVVIYKDSTKKDILTKIEGISLSSFVVLGKFSDAYKIQLEASNNDNYEYNYQKQVGYIDKEIVSYLLNEDKIKEKKYIPLHFVNNNKLGKEVIKDIVFPLNRKIEVLNLEKKDYDFISFEQKSTWATKEMTFKPIFKAIKNLKVHNLPIIFKQNETLDLRNSYLTVVYSDDTRKVLKLNSDNIRNYDNQKTGEQSLIVHYAGKELKVPIYVESENSNLQTNILKRVKNLISASENLQEINKEELFTLQKEIIANNIGLDLETLWRFDKLLYRVNHKYVAYGLVDNQNLDLSATGLNLCLNITPKDYKSYLLKNTFTLSSNKPNKKKKQILSDIAYSYGYQEIKAFDLKLLHNLKRVNPLSTYIVQIKAKHPNKIYTILTLDENNNVYALKTRRTKNYVRFLAHNTGTFLLVEKDSSDFYNLKDIPEVINKGNSIAHPFKSFFQICVLLILALLNLILKVIQKHLILKEKDLCNVYKKLLLKEAIVQDAELKC